MTSASVSILWRQKQDTVDDSVPSGLNCLSLSSKIQRAALKLVDGDECCSIAAHHQLSAASYAKNCPTVDKPALAECSAFAVTRVAYSELACGGGELTCSGGSWHPMQH